MANEQPTPSASELLKQLKALDNEISVTINQISEQIKSLQADKPSK